MGGNPDEKISGGKSGHFVPRGKMDNWTIPDLTSREPSDHQTDPSI